MNNETPVMFSNAQLEKLKSVPGTEELVKMLYNERFNWLQKQTNITMFYVPQDVIQIDKGDGNIFTVIDCIDKTKTKNHGERVFISSDGYVADNTMLATILNHTARLYFGSN